MFRNNLRYRQSEGKHQQERNTNNLCKQSEVKRYKLWVVNEPPAALLQSTGVSVWVSDQLSGRVVRGLTAKKNNFFANLINEDEELTN
jgi:hypothetical protein